MAPPAPQRLSYHDYLALEQQDDQRYEFLDGEVWAMAGGTLRHAAIKTNLTGLLFGSLRGGPCRLYDADAKTLVATTGLATYADLAAVCGDPIPAAIDRHALTNPTALFEVLSPSTEAWDRGAKFHHYQQIPTLQHYVLISDNPPRVEVFTRNDDAWVLRTYTPGTSALLPALEVSVLVDAIFDNLPPESEPEPPEDEVSSPAIPSQ